MVLLAAVAQRVARSNVAGWVLAAALAVVGTGLVVLTLRRVEGPN